MIKIKPVKRMAWFKKIEMSMVKAYVLLLFLESAVELF